MIAVLPFIIIISALFKGKTATNAIFLFLRIWSWTFSILCFFPVRIKKAGTFDPKKAYIYVCNHNSYLDAIAVVIAIQTSFKPLGKIEMVKIPLFGLIYQRVVVMIDRASKKSRAGSVEELKRDLVKGQSILIFPEGTMNRGDEALTDFYDGAFRLAIETQTPLAPMVILNARNLLPRARPFDARPGPITCIFDEPVNVNGLTPEDLEGLKAKVYAIMKGILQKSANI
ncbi:MAG: lysophospholipid acyltransferase family protein [Daejeonella sp.]